MIVKICDDSGKVLRTVNFADEKIKSLFNGGEYNAAGIAQDILGDLVWPLTDAAETIIG